MPDVTEIEGNGGVYAKKLEGTEISSCEALLQRSHAGRSRKDREGHGY